MTTAYISRSKCDVCSFEGYGTMHTDPYEVPIYFECLLCDPKTFEEVFVEERKSSLSQDEESSAI